MFWKSTAIFVQATSRPSTGLVVRPFHASADKMSEAVNSDVLSGGRIDIRCVLSPVRPQILAVRWPPATTHDTVHGYLFSVDCARFSHSHVRTQANSLFV